MKRNLILMTAAIFMVLFTGSCKKKDRNAAEACFTFPDEITAGSPVGFLSSCSMNGISFTWNFGDGSTSGEENPSHTFASTGQYTVTLSVVADNGTTDAVSVTITVTAPTLIEHAGQITEDQTWIEGEHLITGDVYVQGATLTIAPGAVIRFNQGRGLYFGYYTGSSGATLIANGTGEKPIVFTSSASTKTPGDWDYIGFHAGASDLSSMQHCVVEYGGGSGTNYGMIYVTECALSIINSSVMNSETQGIVTYNGGEFSAFTGNEMESNGESAIEIEASYVHTIGAGNSITSSKGIAVKGGRMEQETVTWLKQTTYYRLLKDLYVGSESGSTITLEPGVEIRMSAGTGLYIGYYSGTSGTLIAEGTESEHITFTSSAPEASRSPGDWDYIGFYDGAGSGSSFDYCDFSYGGGSGANNGMIYADGSGFSLKNSTVTNSQYGGIVCYTDGMFSECSGNSFDSNGTYPIEIYANYAHTIGSGNTFGGKGILVKGDRMEQTEVTWLKQNVPYIVSGDIYLGLESGAKLTIEPGTVVSFTQGSALNIGYYSNTFGILIADAGSGTEITFTSAAPSGFESAGDWDGIVFYDGTGGGTILDHCIIRYGGGLSNSSGNITVQDEGNGIPVISNCTIENSAKWGIYIANGSNPTLTDNSFANNASGDVNL